MTVPAGGDWMIPIAGLIMYALIFLFIAGILYRIIKSAVKGGILEALDERERLNSEEKKFPEFSITE